MNKGEMLVRVARIINSCETVEQLHTAKRYAGLAVRSLNLSPIQDSMLRFDFFGELKNRSRKLRVIWNP